jgi:hypothetical protein
VLLACPDAPNTVTAGQVTWNLATTAVTKDDMTILKEFDYSTPHTFSWSAASDSFHAQAPYCAYFGDVDGDGQRDTCLSVACAFDDSDDDTTDLSYGCILVFDNTPGTQTPDYTAEMAIKVQDEDWVPASMMFQANTLSTAQPVDNNQDGSANDVVVTNSKMVLSLSFDYTPVVRGVAGARNWEIYD